MSDHATTAHSDEHGHDGHGDEHPHSHKEQYIKLGIILFIVTAIELVILPDVLGDMLSLTPTIINVSLVLLSVFKLAAVVGIFMHLRDDRRIYTLLFMSPMVIAIIMIVVLMAMAIGTFSYPKWSYAELNHTAGAVAPPMNLSEEQYAEAFAAQADTNYASGKAIFETYCAGCHRIDGGGGIGPAFTDNCYIHGGSFKEMENILNVGVSSKGMPLWKGVIEDTEIRDVVLYARSMRGKDVPKPKECQGEPVK